MIIYVNVVDKVYRLSMRHIMVTIEDGSNDTYYMKMQVICCKMKFYLCL